MISLKGSNVQWSYYDEIGYEYITKTGVVVSEPYSSISSSYGSPPRSGLVTSNTSSTTCIVILSDDGIIIPDVIVSSLEIVKD